MLLTSQVMTFKLGVLLGSTMERMDQTDSTPQILGPALSGAFINGLGNDTECPHDKGAGKRLGGLAVLLLGRITL